MSKLGFSVLCFGQVPFVCLTLSVEHERPWGKNLTCVEAANTSRGWVGGEIFDKLR
eukprot:m.60718 g.60718  ORF g.60718 m.60718 type:complete len:56 (-) comp9522_c0_seq1:2042-2209(-)